MMAQQGFSVESWPFTPGCDASGIVVKTGPNSVSALGTEWKEGDRVFGCTRVGTKGHTAWAEYFLFDTQVCFPIPQNLSLAEVAGMGVGLLTATVGVFTHLAVPLVDVDSLPEPRNEWALVFGGSGSVGQFAVQLLKLAGFQVVTTSSAKSFDVGPTSPGNYSRLLMVPTAPQIYRRIRGGRLP
jgi:NADPH:quinone reductase-like Zn-dependent oxidoreductase